MTELQEHLLKLMTIVDDLCRKYAIDYYLLGGTLIGALRHKGFIPWDDDADVIMSRDNWDKFYKYAVPDIPKGYKISTQYDDIDIAMPINRLTETTSTGFFRYHLSNPEIAGTQIDLFIMDPVPDTDKDKQIYRDAVSEFSELTGMQGQFGLRNGKPTHFSENWEKSQDYGKRQVADEITRKAFHYTEEESQLYGQRFGGSPHFWPKEVFGKPQYVPFENTKLPIPERPGDCLTIGYDDDWKLIPRSGPTLSMHDFSVRCFNTPSDVIWKDFVSKIDYDNLKKVYIERKFEWEKLFSIKFNTAISKQQFHVNLIQLKYKKVLENIDVKALVEKHDYDALRELFDEYIVMQSDSKLIGSSSLSGWIQYYRKHHPLLIDIGDDALIAVLKLLIHDQRLALAVKICNARFNIQRSINKELEDINNTLVNVRKIISTYDCNENSICREAINEGIKTHPDNPYYLKYDLFMKIREGMDKKSIIPETKKLLGIINDDDDLLVLVADTLYGDGNVEKALDIYKELIRKSNNGIILNHIKEVCESLYKETGVSEIYNLWYECRMQCGERSALEMLNGEKDSEDEDGDSIESENNEVEEDDKDDLLTDVQKCKLELLNELKAICQKNKISYYLGDMILLQALEYKKYLTKYGDIVVYMTPSDAVKFEQAVIQDNRGDRSIESMRNNPSFYRCIMRYCNTNTIDFSVTKIGMINSPGIGITIDLLRPTEKNRFSKLYNRLLEKGWDERTSIKEADTKKKISGSYIDTLCKVFGEKRMAKYIFDHVANCKEEANCNSFYVKKFRGKRIYLDKGMIENTSEIQLEGDVFKTFRDPQLFLKKRLKNPVTSKDLLQNAKYNKYARILDADVSYSEYFDYLANQGVDSKEFHKNWTELKKRSVHLYSLTKTIRYHWYVLSACGTRFNLYDEYHSKKPEIIRLYNMGGIDAVLPYMEDLYTKTDEFAKNGVGLFFDSDLFEMLLEYTEKYVSKGKANKFKKLVYEINWTEVKKEEL